MLCKRHAIELLILGAALWLAPACTVQTPDDGGTAGGSSTNHEGGTGGSPVAHGGSAGKSGGSAGKSGGSAGKSGGPPNNTVPDAGAGGEGGEGGEGGGAQCPGCTSGFCLDDGSCVDCSPTNDHCPSGQYCDEHYECAPGCKNDTTSCASGVCGEDHNCKRCINDSECTPEYICSSGECTAACTAEQEGTSTGCGSGMICCSQRCSNLMVDSQNCGACGQACGSGQFCGRTTCADNAPGSCVECHDTTLSNVCSVGKVTVILDSNKNPSDGNRVPGRALGAALEDKCTPKPLLTEAEQDSVEALNITTGRPVSDSSELLVVAGGPFFQSLEGYLEEQHIMPLYWAFSGEVTEFRRSTTKQVVVSLPTAGDHDSHDIFIIQFARDPASGSLVLNEQGFWLSGTVAGAYQLTYGLLPELAQQDQAWYAYEWTDLDGDRAPDLNEIHLLDSGH